MDDIFKYLNDNNIKSNFYFNYKSNYNNLLCIVLLLHDEKMFNNFIFENYMIKINLQYLNNIVNKLKYTFNSNKYFTYNNQIINFNNITNILDDIIYCSNNNQSNINNSLLNEFIFFICLYYNINIIIHENNINNIFLTDDKLNINKCSIILNNINNNLFIIGSCNIENKMKIIKTTNNTILIDFFKDLMINNKYTLNNILKKYKFIINGNSSVLCNINSTTNIVSIYTSNNIHYIINKKKINNNLTMILQLYKLKIKQYIKNINKK